MIYFDNAASTKPTKECLDIFYEASLSDYQNPNSTHFLGINALNRVLKAKKNILNYLKLGPDYEVIFTSGATESNNLAIKGYCYKNRNRGNRIITTSIEHESVLNVFKELETEGFDVVYLPIEEDGTINISNFEKEMNSQTILVSVMPVNNEVGNILNIKEISEVVKKYPKCVLHSDAAQTLGKINFDYNLVDMFTISGHKINGIKGIGALVKKSKIRLAPLHDGGGQENGLRSGTLDFPAILSFEKSVELATKNFVENEKNIGVLWSFLEKSLENNPEISLNLYKNQCKYILNFILLKKKASVIVEALSNNEIYVSSVSACNSKKEEPSHVLLAFGKSIEDAKNTIRVSLGKDNTLEECKIFIDTLTRILSEVKDR